MLKIIGDIWKTKKISTASSKANKEQLVKYLKPGFFFRNEWEQEQKYFTKPFKEQTKSWYFLWLYKVPELK